MHGIDLSERMLAPAREKVRQAGWGDRITLEKTAMDTRRSRAQVAQDVLDSLDPDAVDGV